MNDIVVPRWEWRTFDGDLGVAAARLVKLEPLGIEKSDEVYLLSSLCDANVKIRDGLIDIKRLEKIDSDGLELWRPVLKAGFPLPAKTVALIFQALAPPVPSLPRSCYSQDELIDELQSIDPTLRVLGVHKTRARYRIGDCLAELTDVVAGGRSVRTLAVESEEPGAVIGAVRELGLSHVLNLSYPQALKALIGMSGRSVEGFARSRPGRYAAIDVGTNSVKLYVGERDAAGHWRRVLDRVEVTRLGEALRDTGELQPAAQARTIAAIAAMAEQAKAAGTQGIVAVGTMGLRSARNSPAFLDAVLAACGVAIEIIDSEEEARLAYLAVQEGLGLPEGDVVVFDTGGGSTQVTLARDRQVVDRFSLNLGAVRLTEQFGLNRAVGRETLTDTLAAVAGELARLDSIAPPAALVGLGGAVTNMAAVSLGMSDYDPDRIQGFVLTRAEVERQIHEYAARDAAQRQGIRGLQPGRAPVILAGACIVLIIMKKLGQDRLFVSDRALRHGLLIERFSG